MKNLMSTFIIITLFFVFLSSSNCSKAPSSPSVVGEKSIGNSFEAEDTVFLQMDVENGTVLNVVTINGNVDVQQVLSSQAIEVCAVKRVKSYSLADAEAQLGNIEVLLEKLSNEILVRTFQPNNQLERVYSVDYLIRIPKNFNVQVNCKNGKISLKEIFGSVEVQLENGEVVGEVILPETGVIDLQLTNGSAHLEIPDSTSATFSATTENGTVQVSGLVFSNQIQSPHSFQGVLGSGTGEIRLSTVNGNIDVSVM